jgi:hypothetical protein
MSAPQPWQENLRAVTCAPSGDAAPAAGGSSNEAPQAMHQRPGDGGAPQTGHRASSGGVAGSAGGAGAPGVPASELLGSSGVTA